MKAISYILIIGFLALFALAILGLTNYAGIGDSLGGFMQTSLMLPLRDTGVGGWNYFGTSGWLVIIGFLIISLFGAAFWVPVFYGLFLKKGLYEKVLHKTSTVQPTFQNQPQSTTIPLTNLQSQPTVVVESKNPFNKTEEQT